MGDVLRMLDDPESLNRNQGKSVYILLQCGDMSATTKITDLNRFLEESNVLSAYTDEPQDVTLIYGLVLNPAELPFGLPADVPKDHKLYVIMSDSGSTVELEEVDSFEAAVDYIEDGLLPGGYTPGLDIEDFAVIYGKELKFKIQVVSSPTKITVKHKTAFGV